MIIVSEIYDQIGRVLGNCDESYVFEILTSAIELLANKPTQTNVLWDSLIVYVDLPIVDGYYVCLPPHILKPLKININKQPSFTRNQFYEFSLNGPGTMDPEAGWSWQDRGWKALQKPWPLSGDQFIIMSTDANDTGTNVLVNAVLPDQSTQWITAIVGTAVTTKVINILEVSKPVTKGTLQLYSGPYIIESKLVANWGPTVLYPQFEWIKLSQTGVSCKILARRRTYKITQQTDVIPLTNRLAIVTACIAVKAYQTLNWDDGGTAEQNALRFLDEDQAARNLYQRVSNAAETSPTLNLNIGTRDALIVADIYDFACDVFGPIGQTKIFDRITEALELLQNLSNWDPLIGYVDIQTWDSFFVTLPQYVDQILSINVNKSRGVFRNQWFEFHLNSLGQDNDFADNVGSTRPCGGWEEVGEMPCAFPLTSPAYLVAYPVNPSDSGTSVRAFGIDQNDLPIFSVSDGKPGARITCEQTSYDISDQATPFKRIDRIVLGDPQGFIQLFATDGVVALQNLGTFWPSVSEPRFRIIKIGQKAVTIRIRYRKRWLKISSLTDPLHLRSRSAVFNALRSIQASTQDANAAAGLLMVAKTLLNQEWRSTHPNEELILQFDPDTWGGSMVTMPGLNPVVLLATIHGLFPVSSPAHISWLVAAIIIYALQGQPWFRRFTNMAVKGLKRLLPFLANCDASRLVIPHFFRSLRTVGAQFHVKPRQVNLRPGFAVCASENPVLFSPQTSATFRACSTQGTSSASLFVSAVTPAQPQCLSVPAPSSLNNKESTKTLPNNVNSYTHPCPDLILVGVTHLAPL